MDLNELALELARQRDLKKDFIADTRSITVRAEDTDKGTDLVLCGLPGGNDMSINQHAHRQLGDRLGIPAKYYDRLCKDHVDLLAFNVNALFSREPQTRMVRTIDGTVRAFLSDRYRPLDNYDFAENIMTKLLQLEGEVIRCDLTDTRLYIKAIIPGVERIIKKEGVFFGDGGHNHIHKLIPGMVAGNSEVGAGALFFQPGIHEDHCSNLAVFNKNAMRKHHVGSKHAELDEKLQRILSDETRRQTDKAFWMQVQDLVEASFDGDLFEEHVAECQAALTGKPIEHPQQAIKQLENLTENEQDGVLSQLIQGGDLSKFGLQYAVTRFAQDVEDADRRVELERFGGDVIELPTHDWERLAA